MDREQMDETRAVGIERGEITERRAGSLGYEYRVKSATRDGIVSRWMDAVNAGVNEYQGEPPYQRKYAYGVGTLVYYFMFPDGRGMVLGPAREIKE